MTSGRTAWEYLTLSEAEVDLAALGRDGWELAAVGPTGALYFKRPALDFRERITLDQRAAVATDRAEQTDATA